MLVFACLYRPAKSIAWAEGDRMFVVVVASTVGSKMVIYDVVDDGKV